MIKEKKRCRSCKANKNLSNFHKYTRGPDGHQNICIPCRAREATSHRHKKYGLLEGDYDLWRESQNFSCAICGTHEDENYKTTDTFPVALAVDHCHLTLDIRGLLCWRCNLGLGYFADSPEKLRSAANYIEQHIGNSLSTNI
jgi:hypothetical protein